MDSYNAFLKCDLDKEVYIEIIEGFYKPSETNVHRLLKSLYGLNEVSRQWNIKLTSVLLITSFVQSTCDYSLFTFKKNTDLVLLLVYFDYFLVTGSSTNLINATKLALHQ